MRCSGLLIACLTIVIGISGCRASKDIQETKQQRSQEITAEDKQRATQHFVEGSLYEMQGDYERAINEYKLALRYDDNAAIHYALSKNYLELGRPALAAEAGREAVQRDSSNITYRENLARVYISARELDKAIEQYEEIVKLDPSSINPHFHLARLYQFEKPLKALEVYHNILNRFGDRFEILAQIADINNSLGRYYDAADAIKRMIELDPGNVGLKLTLANTYVEAEEFEKAKNIYLELYETNPDDLEVLTSLVDLYVYMKDYNAAAQHLNSVLTTQALSVEEKLHIGEIYYRHMHRDSLAVNLAMSVFDVIVEQYPDDPRGHWYRGAIASFTRDHDEALKYFSKVIELDPENSDAWVLVGSIYFEREEFDILINFLTDAVELHKDDFDILFLLGLSHNRLHQLDDAANYLRKAVGIQPDNINALAMLALTYDMADNHVESDSLYEIALTHDPDNHLVLNNYSYSLAEREEQLDRALEMSNRAVDMEPENTAYLDTLGWIYFKLGNLKKAKQFIRKAIDLGSDSAVVHDHMGDIYYHLNDIENALKYWNKAIELDDTKEEIKEKIERGAI